MESYCPINAQDCSNNLMKAYVYATLMICNAHTLIVGPVLLSKVFVPSKHTGKYNKDTVPP